MISILVPLAPVIAKIFSKSKAPTPVYTPADLPRPSWLTPGINWTVCGSAGVGKSSMVNKLRGLTPRDPGAAPVGVKETTLEPRRYSFPDNDNICLWDLPGGSTAKFPAHKYVVEFGLRHMSGVVLVTASRASQLDVEILTVLNEYKVPWYYVRNKLDQDIASNLHDHGKSPEETIAELKADLVRNMRAVPGASELPASRVFVLSARPDEPHGHWREFSACIAKDLETSYAL